MANYNLTGQQIRDTFEQLGQVSGSIEGGISGAAVVDGTGSRVTTLHVTASNALNSVSSSFASTATSASYAPNTGVTSIIAGTNVTIDQPTGAVTISATGGGGSADTGSLLVTASNVDATITYTKGDGSTFTNIINNVANATEAEDLVITVKNTSGGTLAKGTAVHAVGVTGQNVDIIAASNDSAATMPAIGLLSQEITNNASGTCIIQGRETGISTTGLSAGDPVYVHTAGALTATKPTGSALIQNIGTAAKINGANGEIIIQGSGRVNDLPNILEGYAWVGDSNGVPQAVATSSFAGGGAAFPFTGNAQITGSLVVSQSGLSSGEDVFVLGAPRTGGSSLEGVIRSTVDDGLHLYGNKNFNNGATTFGGGIFSVESGPVNIGAAGSPVSLDMQNGSAITASNGTLPISGNVDIDGDLTVDGGTTTINVGNSTAATATPDIKLYNAYNGTDVKFGQITINDTTGTYNFPSLFGRFSNATPFGNTAGNPFTVIAGGSNTSGEFLHWSFVMDHQVGDIKVLKELSMRQGANITGSLDISGAVTASNASFQSASIGYLQTVTGSATIIGDQYIVLNADSPTARFAGLKVYDSGSGLTGSFEWDSVDDNWIQVETGGSSAGMLTGASGSKGSETYPTNNYILKGTGNHTVVDSSIEDNGTLITLGNDVQADGSINFSTYVDLKQQSVNILTGSASELKLRSDNFSITDLSNDEYINFDNNLVSSRKNIEATGSISASNGFNSTGFNKSSTFNGSVSSLVGSIQALGGGGITVGNSGFAQQYPSVNVYTNSGSYSGQIYGSHRITDLSGNNDIGILALSTFNAGDPGRIVFETQFNSDVVWWISENKNRFHVEKEISALAGLQATGSVDITGSLDINGTVNNNIQTVGVTSNTASIDLSSANMFEITLADATTYLFDVTNNGAGKTATLLVKQSPAGTGAVDWGSVFRWSGGSKPSATAGAGSEDMYTLVTYSASEVYAVQTPNMSA